MTNWLIKHRNHILFSIIVLIFLGLAVHHTKRIYIKNRGYYIDYLTLIEAGKEILKGTPIYNGMNRTMEYVYAPCIAVWFGIWQKLIPNPKLDMTLYILFNWIYYFVSVFLLLRVFTSLKKEPYKFTSYLLVLSVISPFWGNLDSGNINGFLFCLLTLFLYFLYVEKEIYAGFFLALAILVKLPFLIFILFIIFEKRWKCLMTLLITLSGFTLLPALVIGWQQNMLFHQEWINFLFMKRALNENHIYPFANKTLINFLSHLIHFFRENRPENIILKRAYRETAAFACITILISAYLYRRSAVSREEHYWGKASVFVILMLICNPHAWSATFMPSMIPFAFIFYQWTKKIE